MGSQGSFEEIQRLVAELTTREGELRHEVLRLSASLMEICNGVDVRASSENVTFWELEPTGDFEHGHLAFDSADGISIWSRDVGDCVAAAHDRDEYGGYGRKDVKDVPIDWIRRAVSAGALTELLTNIGTSLNQRLAETTQAKDSVVRFAATPTLAIGSAFEDVARQIGYETVLQDWKAAELDIVADPGNAIARSCSLAESVCKHLLDDLGSELPAGESIQPLFKATAKALGLDPAEQAEPELRGLCGGLTTVTQNLGALRTKFSTAHGRGPADTILAPAHARLAVNAAGNICTFLMEQWQLKKQTGSDA